MREGGQNRCSAQVVWKNRWRLTVKALAVVESPFGRSVLRLVCLMSTVTAPAEFTLTRKQSERTHGPARWIWSHAVRYWPILVMLVGGAIGNAALAAAIPVLVGNAFNDMLKPNPDLRALVPLALILGGSQILRGGLQFFRNFGAELMAQKIERDIRDELYVSL